MQELVNPTVTVERKNILPSIGSVLSPIAGLISGGLDMLSQRMQNKWQSQQATLQNQRQMELSKYQYQQQKEMFNLANQYNTPASQMQRYKDAGLNPNLIYGQGTSGNAPNVLPQYKAPEYEANIRQPVSPAQSIDRGLDSAIRYQQLENLKAQRRILEADAMKKTNEAIWSPSFYRGRGLGSLYSSEGKQFDLQFKQGILPYRAGFSMLQEGLWYRQRMAELAKTNVDIALAGANRDLRTKEVAGYMTPLGKSLWNLGTTVAGGVLRGGASLLAKRNVLKGVKMIPGRGYYNRWK